jgi:tetratricopeptide (TPR) repeat protein
MISEQPRESTAELAHLAPKSIRRYRSKANKPNPVRIAKLDGIMSLESTMSNGWRWLIAVVIAVALASIWGCDKQRARSQMKDGLRAYHSGEYPQAKQHFETASALDPNLVDSQVALAVTATKQYLEFVPTPETTHYADEAVSQFKHVLDNNPSKEQRILCLKGLSTVYVKMEKFDDAYEYNHTLIDLAPDIPDSYYAIGVIEWTKTYKLRMDRIGLVHQSQDEFTTDATACEQLRNTNAAHIQSGISALQKAVSLRPQDYSAMSYLNLIYREKAHIDCTDKDARANDVKTADEWIDRAMLARSKDTNVKAGDPIHLRDAVYELKLPTETLD